MKQTLQEFLQAHKRHPVIAVTGPAGAGKSTVVSHLQELMGAKTFTELPDTNPFLSIIKQTKGRVDSSVFSANQNYFLATDMAQIALGFQSAINAPSVFDFGLQQVGIFSDMTLSGSDKRAFGSIFRNQARHAPPPDVVVEITLPTEELILRMRGRRAHIDDQLIEQAHRLNAYYSHGAVESFYGPKTPLLSFDNSRRSTPDQLQQFVVQLVSKIQAKI